jgi:flagellar biosynthesis protein FlhF
MIVKKFQAPTEMEAIVKAREELGSAAVVLNIKTIKQRGFARLFKKDVVEVTAALEEKDITDGINKSRPTFDNSLNSQQESAVHMINQSMVSNGSTSSINLVADDDISVTSASAIEQKLDSLHNLLQNQGSAASSFNRSQPGNVPDRTGIQQDYRSAQAPAAEGYMKRMSDIRDDISGENIEIQQVRQRENVNYKFLQLIYNKLIDNEVDSRYADEIIGEIENSLKKESNLDSILSAVYQKIILKLGKPKTITLGDKAKVIFFIGPTGVGKTTTIAKIASSFKIEKEAKVAFITADTYRIAAVEQLNTYASIIDCPVSVVYSVEDMNRSLSEYKDYDLILVDTAGRSHKAEAQMDELKAFIAEVVLKLGKPKTITLGDKAKVIFFIGPTGVGKTTTIAKIASSFKIEKEAKVAFITADTYRIAAVEQLNTYASIIDCPVSVVYSVEDMNRSLSEYKDYDLILVDTAGRSHKAEAQMDELKAFIAEVAQREDEFDFECYLTLSMTTKYKDLRNIADKYDDVDWAVIFTKLDETCSLGNILNVRMLTDRQLSYTTSGQNVPDDIEVINEQGVAKQLLGGGE